MRKTESLQTTTVDSLFAERRLGAVAKRAFDVVLGLVALIVGAPLMLLIAILIKLDSPGPVLFVQTRLGKDGQPFTFYKFRSMYVNSGSEVHQQYVRSFIRAGLNGGSAHSNGRAAFKLQHDPRVTRVGRVLRKTSLDELPQIFNILKGEMSFVGPRPALPYEVLDYQEWHRGRLAAVPGLTGLWQVRGRSRVPFDEMVRMDLEYIENQSLWLDLKIIILTVPAVITGRGAG